MNQLPTTQHSKNVEIFDDISSVLTYYGKGKDVEVQYITDLHLDHHVQFYGSENSMIRTMVEKLYKSIDFNAFCQNRIVMFGGDIASNPTLSKKFYKTFLLRLKFEKYKKIKSKIKDWLGMTYDDVYKLYCKRIFDMQGLIEKQKKRIEKWIDFDKFYSQYTSIYEVEEYISSYEKEKSPVWMNHCLVDLIKKTKKLTCLKEKLKSIVDCHQNASKVTMTRYNKDYVSNQDVLVFVVLGNHELTAFETVNEGVSCYKVFLDTLGIHLLHNSTFLNEKILIYGGIGFSKYNDVWNAETVVCCPNFTRKEELNEGELFETGYKSAKKHAEKNDLCFICVSHYPIADCLKKRNNKTIYFSGHSHRNIYIKNEDLIWYADNQIGYTNNEVAFKKASWGLDFNPYYYFQDGAHITTLKDYLQFYRYLGEHIGNGELLAKRCGEGKLYVIKVNGYYGFFIQNEKGIAIVNGGQAKKICKSTNIDWISANFSIVVEKYYRALAPLRKLQLALSSELKALGFDGGIHGCIVDVDYYNHILVNPANGELAFYYSEMWGEIQFYSSFQRLLKGMEKRALSSPCKNEEAKSIKQKRLAIERMCKQEKNAVVKSNSILLSHGSNYETNGLIDVSRNEGAYEASRRVNILQRLFTGRVLRDFDVSLTEIQNADPQKRKKNYVGCLCYFRDVRCIVTQDDNMDLLEFTELNSGRTHIMSLTEFQTDIIRTNRRFNAKLSYWETHSLKESHSKYPEIVAMYIKILKNTDEKEKTKSTPPSLVDFEEKNKTATNSLKVCVEAQRKLEPKGKKNTDAGAPIVKLKNKEIKTTNDELTIKKKCADSSTIKVNGSSLNVKRKSETSKNNKKVSAQFDQQDGKITRYKNKIGIVGRIDVLYYYACNRQAQYRCLMCGYTWSISPNKFQENYNNKCPNCKK